MKKIILPTDFSENAYNAIRYALQLFRDEECTFYLVNTYTPAVYQAEYVLHSPGQIGLGDLYQSNSMELLEDVKTKLLQNYSNPKHTIITHAAFNMVADEVKDMVEKEGADLVVMGTQGATGAKEILFGTHTVHVIKQVHCPVIVVPSGFEYESPKEILFPTDYEVAYDELRLQVLLDIAKLHRSSVEVIHISAGYELSDVQEKNRKKLGKLLGKTSHLFHDLPSQEIITAINTFQQKTQVNFLVMVRNKHTFLERLFIEPVVKKIAFHVTIPFMVIPA
jgi:nucleotide-binding universal stress UspA family protein